MIRAGMDAFDWYGYLSSFGFVEHTKKKRKKQKAELINAISAFDIETSTVWLNPDHALYDVHSFMYVWQMQIEDQTIMGRTWEEFFNFLDILRVALRTIQINNNLSECPFLVIWVHNLAYEWTFLSGLYPFRNDEIFFRQERKPIYCRMFDCFEFRCSYLQTNLSLSALCKETGVEEKKSGQKFNYDVIRFPWSALSDFELDYCITDVKSLVQAMKRRIVSEGDTLLTVPITSTGYVRRDCKEALKSRYLDMREMKPGVREYKLLRKCFRGGDTHANRFRVGQIVNDVFSYDISSSYPTQQLTQLFPMSPFRWIALDGLNAEQRVSRLFHYIGLGYAVCGRYQFKGMTLKNSRDPMPYISLSKCDVDYTRDYVLDNGRILEAGYLEICLTEIDLEIILDQYSFEVFDCLEFMVAEKDYLPEEYREVIQKYYDRKTALKGDDSPEGKYIYTKSKNKLNAVYGMSATDPIHQDVIYDPDHLIEQVHDGDYYVPDYKDRSEDELLKILKNASFPYQFGVYTTAQARKQLRLALYECYKQGKMDDVLYVDTDSIKIRGSVDLSKLNEKLKENAIRHNAYADDMHGVRHYIGLFEDDGHYKQFITQGAKRYAVIKDSGKMDITVAGVSKKINEKTGVSFAVEELKSLSRFKPDKLDEEGNIIERGMVWEKAGGTMSVYNDKADRYYTDSETGQTVHITKNVAIIPTTYRMTYSKDYRLLLNEIQLYSDYQRERS